jgi:hypothetical protein
MTRSATLMLLILLCSGSAQASWPLWVVDPDRTLRIAEAPQPRANVRSGSFCDIGALLARSALCPIADVSAEAAEFRFSRHWVRTDDAFVARPENHLAVLIVAVGQSRRFSCRGFRSDAHPSILVKNKTREGAICIDLVVPNARS